jgi:hypothetical protein
MALATVLLGSMAEPKAHAQVGVAAKALSEALGDESASQLTLRWQTEQGPQLQVEAGVASLLRCADAAGCTPLAPALTLSTGERSQLLSRLRASDLFALQSSESSTSTDRTLTLRHATRPLGTWRLPRADWPTPPDGDGLPDYLDELSRRIAQAAQVRKPVAVPQTIEALRALRLQLRVEPRRRPGGQVQIEAGVLKVTPEEGFVPRSPLPRPSTRTLLPDEEQRLLSLLQQARLDDLDRLIEKREQPAIGDDDGRLLTLHLLPSESSPTDSGQARGLRRYVADVERSPAAPLVQQLMNWLTVPAATPQRPRARR